MAVTGGLGAITNLAIKEITKKAKKVAEDVDEETMLQAIKINWTIKKFVRIYGSLEKSLQN